MSKRSTKWSDLSKSQRAAIVVGGAIEAAMTGWVLRDLYRRSSDSVRGPKALWVAAMVVQPFGPIAYGVFGRREYRFR